MKLNTVIVGSLCAAFLALPLAFADCPPECPVPGGGSKKTDCFAEFSGVSPSNPKKPTNVVCTDGEACDADGAPDGTCTFALSVCLNNADPRFPRCDPGTTTKVKVKKAKKDAQLQALQSAIDTVGLPTAENKCSTPVEVKVPLRVKKKKGKVKKIRPGKKVVKLLAVARKKDPDKVKLTCLQNVTPPSCPANPTDGPDLMILTVGPDTDLDTGWNGVAHNQTIVQGGRLLGCLSNCDLTSDTVCDVAGTDVEGPEGSTVGGQFGPPLPLLVAADSVAVCITNTHVEDMRGSIDLASGMADLFIHLESRVVTGATQDPRFPCPVCTGSAIGDTGRCKFGPNDGKRCTVNGLTKRFGNTSFDCPPAGPSSALDIFFNPATTETSTLEATENCAKGALGSGPCHCPGQTGRFDSGCKSYDDCSASNCPSGVGEGIDQTCCPGTKKPCYPKLITRTGLRHTLTPAPPDTTYPKTGPGALVSVFCIGATGDPVVNATSGLPGGGTVRLAGEAKILKVAK